MRIAALILGILGGLAGLTLSAYGHAAVLLLSFGGLPESQRSLALVIMYGIPIATLVGGGLAIRNPAGSAALLLLGAASWFGVGAFFGYAINIFTITPILLSGIGGLLALAAANADSDHGNRVRIAGSASRQPERTSELPSSMRSSYDRNRWQALVKYDEDIAMVAEELEPFGQKWVDEFAASYLALNDKAYLPEIFRRIVAGAEKEREQQEILQEEREVRRRLLVEEQERKAAARKRKFRLWRMRFWGSPGRAFITSLVIVIITSGGVLSGVSWYLSRYVAPAQIVDRDDLANPVDGIKLLAREDIDVYASPPSTVGVAVSSLQKTAVIRAGDWVTRIAGITIALRAEGRAVSGTSYWKCSQQESPSPREGDTIAIYYYVGEGCWRSWTAGQLCYVCGVDIQGEVSKAEGWIQVALADGAKAWTQWSFDKLATEEGLNNDLANAIVDAGIALADKLARIDALLQLGAQLNGLSLKHGLDPIEAAISTRDVELLKALISRGLDLNGPDCRPAWSASQNSLAPGGDRMLAYLLKNGMDIRCLTEPPLHAFLRRGIATDQYPVDSAIKVARILVENGASVHEVDSEGNSIFDVLAQAKSPSKLAPLRDALLTKRNKASSIIDLLQRIGPQEQ